MSSLQHVKDSPAITIKLLSPVIQRSLAHPTGNTWHLDSPLSTIEHRNQSTITSRHALSAQHPDSSPGRIRYNFILAQARWEKHLHTEPMAIMVTLGIPRVSSMPGSIDRLTVSMNRLSSMYATKLAVIAERSSTN